MPGFVRTPALILLLAAAIVLAAAPPTGAHSMGASIADTAYVVTLHGQMVIVHEHNGLLGNGVVIWNPVAHTSGAQIHDNCVVPGWTSEDYALVYPTHVSTMMGYHFYDYIIAQTGAVGLDDASDVADALAFWAAHGVEIQGEDPAFEDACQALGGTFTGPDMVIPIGLT